MERLEELASSWYFKVGKLRKFSYDEGRDGREIYKVQILTFLPSDQPVSLCPQTSLYFFSPLLDLIPLSHL